MKTISTFLILTFGFIQGYTQIVIPVDPHFHSETSRAGQAAIEGYSGPIGIGPFPTNPASIGVLGTGFTGVKGFAKGLEGAGVHGVADRGKYGVYGFSEDDEQISVYGLSAGGRGVVGESFSQIGVSGISPFGVGIYGEGGTDTGIKAYSSGWYGLEVNSGASDGAVIGCANGRANIVLTGSDSPWGGGSDDAIIRSQPNQSGGDLILVSNDYVSIHLDDDNNGSGEGFQVLNGTNQVVMQVDDAGNMVVSGSYDISSDRAKKELITPVDNQEILENLASISVSEWQYKTDPVRHIGPMAQDFYAAFGLGNGEKTISTVDALGVSFASIQALNQRLDKQEKQIQVQENLIREQARMIRDLQKKMDQGE